MSVPRVLIVGHYFSDENGTNITLENLFRSWPIDKIAITADAKPERMNNPNCGNYYSLGEKEVSVIWPLNLFFKAHASVPFNYSREMTNKKKSTTASWKNTIYKMLFKKLFVSTGLSYIRFRYRVSDEFKLWLEGFRPDIVYTLLGDISTMKFVYEIHKVTEAKTAVHIMDDWINAGPTNRLFRGYWRSRLSEAFADILRISDLQFAVSHKMAREYQSKFRKTFVPFHNPIELEHWEISDALPHESDAFVFTYIGKINRLTFCPLLDFSLAVEQANKMRPTIVFKIYTNSESQHFRRKIRSNKQTVVLESVPHSQIPELLAGANGLFLPLAFDERSLRYARLSMPTKASEYMISRRPIIVYAPKETALFEYAKEHNWAITVGKRGLRELLEAISVAMCDETVKSQVTKNAYDLARSKHASGSVRENFRDQLSRAASSAK